MFLYKKIATALDVSFSDIFIINNLENINSIDKLITEKVQLIEQLDNKQKESIISIIDMAIYNIKQKLTIQRRVFEKILQGDKDFKEGKGRKITTKELNNL
jgi:hypothetical protein